MSHLLSQCHNVEHWLYKITEVIKTVQENYVSAGSHLLYYLEGRIVSILLSFFLGKTGLNVHARAVLTPTNSRNFL